MLLITYPQTVFAQIGPISPPMFKLFETVSVIAEVESVVRHPEGDIKTSRLKIYSVGADGDTKDYALPKIIDVEHALRDFELFPGQHLLKLRKSTLGDGWYLDKSSHGEIVNAAERKRRSDAAKERGNKRNHEQELCFQAIKQAYDNDVAWFHLDDKNCAYYIADYNAKFSRLEPDAN